MSENVFNKIGKGLRAEEEIANELDYVEQPSWALFLKYLGDLRQSFLQKAFAGELT
jgi:type I restriction enzyme M protein